MDTNTVPPWMTDRAEEYLSLYEPFPDDFGIPEFITTDQYRIGHERDCRYEDTPERRMAWRLFAITISDCLNGKPEKRLLYIDEIKNWANGKIPDVRWDFGYFCELLGYNEDYVRGKLLKFLQSAEEFATMGESPSDEIKHLLKDIVGKYKSRPVGKRRNNMSRQQMKMEGMAWTE